MPLSARKCATATPGRHTDGRGLHLYVKASGGRSWVLRYQFQGKRRDMGLGSYPEVTLAAARERALEARRLIADGKDPIAVARTAKQRATFADAANAMIASKASGWKYERHQQIWLSAFERYVFPAFGEKDVAAIDTADVVAILQPIWAEKTETASRVRQRVEAVLDYAKAIGAREGENPARWRGHLDQVLPRPSKVTPVRHLAALDWRKAPAFVAELRQRNGVAARALHFIILTAARSGEVRQMRWAEIDLDAGVWEVPAERMKAGKEHRVPLTEAALAILGLPGEPGELVFSSDFKPGQSLSDVAVTKVIRSMGDPSSTVHGWRATFKTWAGESSSFPREVIEEALAHRLKDKAEAAYWRGDAFDKRRALMRAWAEYLAAVSATKEADLREAQ